MAPVVEQVAQRLVQGQATTSKPIRVPTLLSQSNRSAGRDRVRTKDKKAATPGNLSVPAACQECGVILPDRGRQYCEGCLPSYQEVHATSFSEAGRSRMAELRSAGRDPSRGGEAKRKRRGAEISQRLQEQKAWEAEHVIEDDPEAFALEILPKLQGVSLGAMADATGLSQQYCSLIRRGRYVPHPRHWKAIEQLYLGES